MADEPTAGEVSRALDVLRGQTRDDLGTKLAKDVYFADRHSDRQQRAAMQREIDGLRDELAESRRDVAKAKADRAANRKVVIISVIIPIGLAIAEIVVTVRGGH